MSTAAPTDVLVDAWCLGRAPSFRGVGTYQRNLLAALAEDPTLGVAALVTSGQDLPQGVVAVPIRRRAPGRLAQREHDARLPRDVARRAPGVFHEPSPDPPSRCSSPWVQTLFDVIPLAREDADLAGTRRRWRRYAERYRRAGAVVAISRHAADEGIRLLGLDPGKVHVAPLGVAPSFVPSATGPAADPPYLLAVAEHSQRKGLAEAFAIIGALAEQGYPHRLRVAGRIAPWVAGPLEALRAAAPRPERIDLLGYVDDLVAEYQDATTVIVTSRHEGFGLPAAEAMACATPVVAFANSATTEVVGGGGILVDDGDVAAFVRAVRWLLDDAARREETAARGRERARAFDWGRCAHVHAEVYRELAGG